MDFHAALLQFRRKFNQDGKGKKALFMITGGGYSALDFRLGCGSSRFLEACWDPYSNDSLMHFANVSQIHVDPNDRINFGDPASFHSVTSQMAGWYARSINLMFIGNHPVIDPKTHPICIASSAALTSNRYRRGLNQAFISIIREIDQDGNSVWHETWQLHLNKLSEDDHSAVSKFPELLDKRRLSEDRKLGQTILAIIMKDYKMLPDLETGEKISLPFALGFHISKEYPEMMNNSEILVWKDGDKK